MAGMGRTEHKMRKQNAVPLTQFTRWTSLASAIVAVFAITGTALAQNVAPLSNNPTRQGIVQQAQQTPPGQNQGVYSDPLAPFNETMFSFNLKLDDWVLKPVATGYAAITPKVVRQSVERFFDNVMSFRALPTISSSCACRRLEPKWRALESTLLLVLQGFSIPPMRGSD